MTATQYRVGPNATACDGLDRSNVFPEGSLVKIVGSDTYTNPDSDGDVQAERIDGGSSLYPGIYYIAVKHLTPIVDANHAEPTGSVTVESLKAVTDSVRGLDWDVIRKLVEIAQSIDRLAQ